MTRLLALLPIFACLFLSNSASANTTAVLNDDSSSTVHAVAEIGTVPFYVCQELQTFYAIALMQGKNSPELSKIEDAAVRVNCDLTVFGLDDRPLQRRAGTRPSL